MQTILPLTLERTDRTATRPRAYRFGTLDAIWQCKLHCHSTLSVQPRVDDTATRARTFHHHTFTAEWQCTLFREPPDAPVARAIVGMQECTQIDGNGLSEPFWGICVHCCAARVARVAMQVVTRTASGSTSASTTMACRRRPLGSRLSLGREGRLYASNGAKLASSPKRQPTQTPEESN